jgi:hypothetical protein
MIKSLGGDMKKLFIILFIGIAFNQSIYGTGNDGELSVSGTYEIDNVKTFVTGNTTIAGANYITVDNASSFSIGDEILIITIQDPTTPNLEYNTAGQFETHNIIDIVNQTLYLDNELLNNYDASYDRKHQVQKIPNYTNVNISGILTSSDWDGNVGGIIAFRVLGSLNIEYPNGSIIGDGRGFRGGSGNTYSGSPGYDGEGVLGYGNSENDNLNGGSNGGPSSPGNGGQSIGSNEMNKLFFGGGGGSSGSTWCNAWCQANGGDGGGIILIYANYTNNYNVITSDGNSGGPAYNGGSSSSDHDVPGGGSGAGGSIMISSPNLVNYSTISALSDEPTYSYNGYGWGALGYIGESGNIRVNINSNSENIVCNPPAFIGILGCNNSLACNYDSNSNFNDGSCYIPEFYDCDGNCLVDTDNDLVCDALEIYGCTDIEACNYDANATEDNGECLYGDNCNGCTNPDAMNYEEDAVYDDGSCIVPDIIVPDDYSTIQGALNNAEEGQTIFVRAGIYYENIQWANVDGIKLIGEDRETTTIDGGQNGNVIRVYPYTNEGNFVHTSDTVIDGFTIQNGSAFGNEGFWGTGQISQGAGIYINYSSPQLKNLIIKDNYAALDVGGGVYYINNYRSTSDIYFENIDFINNICESYGCGMYVQMSAYSWDNTYAYTAYMNSCNFINNISENGYGAGLRYAMPMTTSEQSTFYIDKSTFIGNFAAMYGSAIYGDGHVIITNSIITGNSAAQSNSGKVLRIGEGVVVNTIIYNNGIGNLYHGINMAHNSLIESYAFNDGTYLNCIDNNPLFTNSENNDYSLLSNSPCIDGGTPYSIYDGVVNVDLSPNEYEGFAPDIGMEETSQMFVPDPIITNIEDIQDDQGGRAYLDFQRSFHDKDGFANRVEVYSVERFDDEWVSVETLSAYNDSTYRVEVTTLVDSSSTTNGLTDFRVIANMEEGNFLSETSTGYSIDNIHPSTPDDVMASSNDNDINISWDYIQDIDFSYHRVSQLGTPSYTTQNEQTMALETAYNEYYMNSIDINDNLSEKSDYVGAHHLHQGANLIGVCVLPEDNSVSNVVSGPLDGIIGEGVAASNNPSIGWVGSLAEISPSDGYWFKASEETIHLTVGDKHETESFELNPGANLISYCCANDIPLDELDSDCIEGIIGEGVAASWIGEMPIGSLTALSTGKGYWVKTAEECELAFECTEYEQQLARVDESESIQDYAQSTEQAFYFIEDIENIEFGDIVSAYCNDIKVGSRAWNGAYTDIPAMGNDNSDLTKDYCSTSSIPTFRVEKPSGETYALTGDIPLWESNGLHMLSTLQEAIILPESYSLAAAYPNPFNPTTTINFAIPANADVSISVYNLQGREVVSLANGSYDAGYHQVIWNADSHSSGVYFVKMIAGSYVNTQKLMLVK